LLLKLNRIMFYENTIELWKFDCGSQDKICKTCVAINVLIKEMLKSSILSNNFYAIIFVTIFCIYYFYTYILEILFQ